MKAKTHLKRLLFCFIFCVLFTTIIFGGVLVGFNIAIPIFSTPRLFLGVSIICFSLNVLYFITHIKELDEMLNPEEVKE